MNVAALGACLHAWGASASAVGAGSHEALASRSSATLFGVVGPMGLGEHVSWFLLISLLTFLVYSGLREEDLGVVVRSALGRWVRFLVGSAVLFGVFSLLSAWL